MLEPGVQEGGRAFLRIADPAMVKDMLARGIGPAFIARETGLARSTICHLKNVVTVV